jgi:hypothetical protein
MSEEDILGLSIYICIKTILEQYLTNITFFIHFSLLYLNLLLTTNYSLLNKNKET